MVLAAVLRRLTRRVEREVVAEGKGRTAGRALPGGTERGRHAGTAVERPGLVRTFEPAAAETAQEHALACPQDGQVDLPVAVDIERIGTLDVRQVRRRIVDGREPQGTAGGAVVVVQRRGVAPAGEVQLGLAVAVAVEGRDAAADGEREVAGVGVVDAGRGGLVDESGRAGGARRATAEPADGESAGGDEQHDRPGAEQDHGPTWHRITRARDVGRGWRGRGIDAGSPRGSGS